MSNDIKENYTRIFGTDGSIDRQQVIDARKHRFVAIEARLTRQPRTFRVRSWPALPADDPVQRELIVPHSYLQVVILLKRLVISN